MYRICWLLASLNLGFPSETKIARNCRPEQKLVLRDIQCYFVFESDLKDSEMSKTKERFERLILNSRTLDLVIAAVVILSENCSLKLV